MGSCISGGGGNVIHDFWYLGKGGEGDKKYIFSLLTYLRSVLMFIKQYSNSMCFSSILS